MNTDDLIIVPKDITLYNQQPYFFSIQAFCNSPATFLVLNRDAFNDKDLPYLLLLPNIVSTSNPQKRIPCALYNLGERPIQIAKNTVIAWCL